MDWKLEPWRSGIRTSDRARAFYVEQAGSASCCRPRSSSQRRDPLRPADATGSACSIALRQGSHGCPPGSVQGCRWSWLDIQRRPRRARRTRCRGQRRSELPWGSFVFFSDPDGNRWAVQQLPPPLASAQGEHDMTQARVVLIPVLGRSTGRRRSTPISWLPARCGSPAERRSSAWCRRRPRALACSDHHRNRITTAEPGSYRGTHPWYPHRCGREGALSRVGSRSTTWPLRSGER